MSASTASCYVDKLRQLFISCDTSGIDLLDKDELAELCDKLQLDEEQTFYIIDHLIVDQFTKVDFDEFKDAFVTLLTRSHVNYEDISSNLSNPNSPVKGKKKEEVKSDLIDTKNDQLSYSNNSDGECDNLSLTNSSTEEYLKNIWDKLRVGRDGYLNMEELYAVCEHIGMELGKDIIEQLFDKLDNDGDGKVSFDELLQGLFKQQQESQQIDLTSERHPRQFIEDDNYGTPGNYFQSLDPLGLGYSDLESVSSLWESFGFSNPKLTLQKLGFDCTKKTSINIRDLSVALEEELYSSFTNASDLFQISLTMFQHEINYMKIVYDQLKAEKDQLRINLNEANARADILAQEVDDHHAKLEKASKDKLILLERRYQDQIRCLQEEFKKEREAMSLQNLTLRQDLASAQRNNQESQLKCEDMIHSLKMDNLRLEKEVQELSDNLKEVIKVNIDLKNEVDENLILKKKLNEIESLQCLAKEKEHQSLLNQIEALQKENKELKDENDSHLLEIGSLNQKLESRLNQKFNKQKSKRWRLSLNNLEDQSEIKFFEKFDSMPKKRSSSPNYIDLDNLSEESFDQRIKRRAQQNEEEEADHEPSSIGSNVDEECEFMKDLSNEVECDLEEKSNLKEEISLNEEYNRLQLSQSSNCILNHPIVNICTINSDKIYQYERLKNTFLQLLRESLIPIILKIKMKDGDDIEEQLFDIFEKFINNLQKSVTNKFKEKIQPNSILFKIT